MEGTPIGTLGSILGNLADDACWVLGAGASYDCIDGSRFVTPLTDRLLSWNMFSEEFQLRLKRLIRSQGEHIEIDTALDLGLEKTIDVCRADSQEATECLKVLVRKISDIIREKQVQATLAYGGSMGFRYCAENYLWLANMTSYYPQQTVLNLNFDTLMDRAYEELRFNDPPPYLYAEWRNFLGQEVPFDGYSTPQNCGIYLKLHGSLDLDACLNRECKNYRLRSSSRLFAGDGVLEDIGRPGFLRNCEVCDQPMYEQILPPGQNKTLQEDQHHQTMRDLAIEALAQTRSWVMVGYSFPEYDNDVADLMKEALDKNFRPDRILVIVSPDANEIAPRVATRLGLVTCGAAEMSFSALVDGFHRAAGVDRPGLA